MKPAPLVIALLGFSFVYARADDDSALGKSPTKDDASGALIATLEQEVAALRRQKAGDVSAADATDAQLAEKVSLTERLLLKEGQLMRRKKPMRLPDINAQREFQQALARATTEEERAAIIARHRAYQRVLTRAEAAETAAAPPPPVVLK